MVFHGLTAFQENAFQNNAFQIDVTVHQTVLTNKKASGPYFTRDRFEALLKKKRLEEEAELRAQEEKRQAEFAKAYADFKARADAQIAKLLEQANAAAAQQLPIGSPGQINLGPDYSLHAAHHAAQDEDDAIALLLLSGH